MFLKKFMTKFEMKMSEIKMTLQYVTLQILQLINSTEH